MTRFDAAAMAEVKPVYEMVPGWQEDITGCRSFDELPAAAKSYIGRLEELLARPVGVISVGPKRSQTIPHKTSIGGLR